MKYDRKILSLAMFVLLMTGCAVSASHVNIVKNVADKGILLTDVETNQERILMVSDTKQVRKILENLIPGDTLWIKSPYYDDLVLAPSMRTVVYYDNDSINVRIRKKQFEAKKQELFSGKVR